MASPESHSNPLCPNILLDGTQLIVRLQPMTPFRTSDGPESNFSSMALSDNDSGAVTDTNTQIFHHIHHPNEQLMMPLATFRNITPMDFASKFTSRAASTEEIEAPIILTPEMNFQVTSNNLSDTEETTVLEVPVGEQVVTITQQVPVADHLEMTPKRHTKSTHKKVFRILWSGTTSQLGLLILLIIYTFIGAAVFTALEENVDLNLHHSQQVNMTHILDLLHNSLHNLGIHQNGSIVIDYKDFMKLLQEQEGLIVGSPLFTEELNSEYWKWFLFCMTAYTTIGYGHIVPQSSSGKIVCIMYSMIGIPLFLMTIGKIGKLCTRGIKTLWYAIKRRCKKCTPVKCRCTGSQGKRDESTGNQHQSCEVHHSQETCTSHTKCCISHADVTSKIDSMCTEKNGICNRKQKWPNGRMATFKHGIDDKKDKESVRSYESVVFDDKHTLPPWVGVTMLFVYIIIGASMYTSWETNWSYVDAVYFVFVSISTIGFGDIVPTRNVFFLLTSVYIIFGLALVAMVISGLTDFFSKTIEHVHKNVTHIHVPALLRKPIESLTVHECDERSPGRMVTSAAPPVIHQHMVKVTPKAIRRVSV